MIHSDSGALKVEEYDRIKAYLDKEIFGIDG